MPLGILLQHDAAKKTAVGPMVPDHVEQPAAAVGVVEQRWIESAAVEIYRIFPWAIDGCRACQEVVRVLEVAIEPADHRIDQPEMAAVMGQARRPDTARIRDSAQVKQRFPVERSRSQLPVFQVARVVDLHARIPLEGGSSDVVIISDPTDRRIGVEAGKYRVAGHRGRVSIPGVDLGSHDWPRGFIKCWFSRFSNASCLPLCIAGSPVAMARSRSASRFSLPCSNSLPGPESKLV